ncbi:pyocin knob domain-containing protein [Bacillus sp. DE0042]|uniref:pyocin knob domain-containing protein n=1 Tax=Bacillus sp. DE0042 TaxID=2584950 RepID=UPI0011A5D4AE|nr:pyocin knob domain-containing protein [Bacillus sp. DE0042]
MPSLTNRLKLALPNGNEYVNRAALNKIFEDIDRLVMLQGDIDTVKRDVNKYTDEQVRSAKEHADEVSNSKASTALSDAKKYVEGNWKQKHQVTSDDGTAYSLPPGTDLNNVENTGFYRGTGLKNSPTSSNGHYVMVIKQSGSEKMQIASVIEGPLFNKCAHSLFIRHHFEGSGWTSWRKISTQADWGEWSTNGGQDLLVWNKRAFVGFNSESGDKLHVNYAGDFKNGVNFFGRLMVDETFDVVHTGFNFMRDKSRIVSVQEDWNLIVNTGYYDVTDDTGESHASTPPNCYPYGTLEVYKSGVDRHIIQRYTSHNSAQMFVRSAWSKSAWTAWRKISDEKYVDDGLAEKLSKAGGTMTGPLVFDVNTEEKVIRGNDSTGPLAGFFFQKNRMGAYDWKNMLPIFGYEADTKTFEVRTPIFKFEERKVLTTSDLEDGIPSRSGKDDNGIYTIYEESHENGKFSKKSILSSPDADGNYLIRTVTYYEDGIAYKTKTFDLKYDEDGDFVKAVQR